MKISIVCINVCRKDPVVGGPATEGRSTARSDAPERVALSRPVGDVCWDPDQGGSQSTASQADAVPRATHVCDGCGHDARAHPHKADRPCVALQCSCQHYEREPLPLCGGCNHPSSLHSARSERPSSLCMATGCQCPHWEPPAPAVDDLGVSGMKVAEALDVDRLVEVVLPDGFTGEVALDMSSRGRIQVKFSQPG